MEIGRLVERNLVTVGPTHTLLDAASMMTERNVGSAVVINEEHPGPGIISERDILRAIASGADPKTTQVDNYVTWHAVVAEPTWDVAKAARTMIRGGFRHLIVLDSEERAAGILSIRDLVAVLFPEEAAGTAVG